MEKLTDFRPLNRVSLPDLGDLRCSGLILIVGPNSSGKSQFLQDIYLRISGEPRALVVASNIEIQKPPEYGSFIEWLKARRYIEDFYDDNGTAHWRPLTTYLGTGQAVTQIQQNQGQNWHSGYVPLPDPAVRRRSDFLNYFGRMLVTALFLDRRLISLNQTGIIDFQTQPPQTDLHALHLDDDARSKLFDELVGSFNKAVWPDASRGNTLCLRVSDQGELPSAEARHSIKKMMAYRTIESEGDGLKSYVAICVALLLGQRPVCLIDEPEMCLHPPQAHNLGRFIGRHGTSNETVTLVATHSSEILRGIIQTASDIQIVRLTRRAGKFSAHLVPAAVLSEAVAKPTVRAESILDGIFAESVIVLEADGDRLVYQTTWETLSDEFRNSVHFATVGGTGGISDTCNLYRTLRIPVAVIADLDLITDPARLQGILRVMATIEESNELVSKARMVMDGIRNLPPTIDPSDAKKRLETLCEVGVSWENEADIELRRELNRLARELDRMRKIKRGGVATFPDHIAVPLNELLSSLKHHGVFLVPLGELEEWLSHADIKESKERKWAWSNEAALYIQSAGSCNGDIWDFVREVGRYLNRH